MPRPTKGSRLGSGPAHQKMMLGGLASQLIIHERIRTTETKAKRLRPVAEKLVSLGKDGSVHARRRALSLIEDREVIHKLFAEVAPRFAERNGGYTRVLKLGTRQGDAAPMAIIEFVDGSAVPTAPAEAEQKRRRGLRRRKPAKPADEGRSQSEASAQLEEEPEPEEEPGVMQGAPDDPGAQAEDDAAAETPEAGTAEAQPGTAGTAGTADSSDHPAEAAGEEEPGQSG